MYLKNNSACVILDRNNPVLYPVGSEAGLKPQINSGRMRNFKQHLPVQCPENFGTPERHEIALQVMVLGGQMRNFNKKGRLIWN